MTRDVLTQLTAYGEYCDDRQGSVTVDEILRTEAPEQFTEAEPHRRRDEEALVTYLPPGEPPTFAGRLKRGRVVAAIAAAALVVAGVVAVADRYGRDEDQPVVADAPTDPTAVQTATAFIDAYSRHDADLAASYLTAETLNSYFDGLEGLRLETSWQVVTGGEILAGRCEPLSGSRSGTTVRCPYEFHGLRSKQFGLGPYGDNYFDLTVIDGEIVSISDHSGYLTNGFSQEVWKPFARWVADRYPTDVDAMFASPAMTNRRASEDSNLLWEQHTREYASAEVQQFERGFVGLAPKGATPSEPERGEMVDTYWVDGGGLPYRGSVQLYADGRLIWNRFGGQSYNGFSSDTGLLEQRLTPEGVELVRTHDDLAEKDPLRLLDWLPASAWEDEIIRPYVPFGYAACLFAPPSGSWPRPGPPPDRAELLDLLPAAAADLLSDREAVPPLDDYTDCLALTTEDAYLLNELLRDAGVDQDEMRSRHVLTYLVDHPDYPDDPLQVVFEPRFPDGSADCSACA